MKKYLVIGNPIEHSLSPKLHNYWIKKNNLHANYDKLLVNKDNISRVFNNLRNNIIEGINVTIPFKKEVIAFLDNLSEEAEITQSVNTIYKQEEKLIGHNTDIAGFELAIRYTKYNVQGKKVLILGAGGVTPSIVYALRRLKASEIFISNRTFEKAEEIKKRFEYLNILKWGEKYSFDMIINATSIGLNNDDQIKLTYENKAENQFFYDVIYNPGETNFLKEAKKNFHKTENGKMMFIYQAHQAFTLWHKLMPEINQDVIGLING
tara:strand:+ start:214 stop:1008 length:795 start_codon:yes stop_codon:yes gene_type:complete